jgi:hypothetical protein
LRVRRRNSAGKPLDVYARVVASFRLYVIGATERIRR